MRVNRWELNRGYRGKSSGRNDYARHADPVCVLLRLLPFLSAVVKDRKQDRISEDDGRRLINHECWRVSVRARSIGSLVPALSQGADDSCCQHYRSSSRGESLRDRTWQARYGFEPIESDPGFQLARHNPGLAVRGTAHFERSAVSGLLAADRRRLCLVLLGRSYGWALHWGSRSAADQDRHLLAVCTVCTATLVTVSMLTTGHVA